MSPSVKTAMDKVGAAAAAASAGDALTYDQWNYFHNLALGSPARDFELAMPGAPRYTKLSLGEFWAAAYAPAAPKVDAVSNKKASKWWQVALGAAGSFGLAALSGQVPGLNAVIPQKWSWVLPVASMATQGILAQRNLKFNPNGTSATMPYVPAGE